MEAIVYDYAPVLPLELLLEVLKMSHPLMILRSRLICRRVREMIDSSASLRLLIELYRDDLYPAPEYMKTIIGFSQDQLNNKDVGEPAQTPIHNLDPADLLNEQLESRRKWDRFVPHPIALVPLTWAEWDFYEINNGYIAYCLGNPSGDTIHFRELRDPMNEVSRRNWKVTLPTKCLDFTFDLSQDLLIMAEAKDGFVSLYLFEASTGIPHASATQTTFEKISGFEHSPISTDAFVLKVMVHGSSACVSYHDPVACQMLVTVCNWRSGSILFQQSIKYGGGAILLTPEILAIVTHQVAGSKPRPPQIHLFELCPPYPPIVQPRIVLLIPEWKGGPDATYSARFLYGSGSVGPDIYQPCQRSGEKDVVPLIIGCETPTDDSEEPTIDENELFLFLCKQRLFDRLSVRTSPIDSVIQQTSDNRYRYPDSVLDDSQLQPISSGWPTNTPTFEIQYDDWGREGTTWLDGTDFFAFNWGSSYGSRFILITKPECIGTAETTSEKIPGYSPFDPVYVCLLEFNNRLLDSGSENRHGDKVEGEGLGMEIALELNVGSGIVTTYPQGYTLLQGLDTKIETVMPFRLRVLKPANVGEWSDVILDRDHIVAASEEGLHVFKI